MKIIDNEGRLFGKISIIDVLVVLLVGVLALALYVKSARPQTGSGVSTQPITFQVLVEGVPQYVVDAVRVDDLLYDDVYESGGALGQIQEIQVQPGSELTEFTDGTYGLAQVDGCSNLLLTVKGEGLISKDGIYQLNRVYDLGVNSARTYYTKYAKFDGRVTHID